MSSQVELPFFMPRHHDALACPNCGQVIPFTNYSEPYGAYTHYDPDTEEECPVLIHLDNVDCKVYLVKETEHPLIDVVSVIHECQVINQD